MSVNPSHSKTQQEIDHAINISRSETLLRPNAIFTRIDYRKQQSTAIPMIPCLSWRRTDVRIFGFQFFPALPLERQQNVSIRYQRTAMAAEIVTLEVEQLYNDNEIGIINVIVVERQTERKE